ncbi:MAG: hypothetical protein ABFD52_12675 [Acidobacteriota bacterium]
MAEPTKKDDFLKSLGVDMDAIKARLAELKVAGGKLTAEAKQDLEKTVKGLEATQKQLEAKMGEWTRAGKVAGADVAEGLKRAARELKKGIDEAASHLKK